MISLDAYAGERQWKAKNSDDWIERRDEFNPEPFVRSPDTTIEKKESHEEIKKAMDALTPKQKEAIELYHCRDLELGHISEILGIKEATARSRIRQWDCQNSTTRSCLMTRTSKCEPIWNLCGRRIPRRGSRSMSSRELRTLCSSWTQF